MGGPPSERSALAAATKARAFGLRTYYVLLLAQAISLLGSQISGLAVSIAVFRQTGHATPLALVAFFLAAPRIVLGGSSGAFQLSHLYLLVLGSAVCAAIEAPAFQASVAMLVPDSHRDRANAIAMIGGPAAGVLAPTIAGLLYATIGVVGSISLDIASFMVAIAVLVVVRIPMPAKTAEGLAMRASIWRQAFDGFRYLSSRPALLGFCGFFSIMSFLALGVLVLEVPYILDRTGSVVVLGVVMGALNFGAVAGAVAMAAWGG